jgi:SPP1 family holin
MSKAVLIRIVLLLLALVNQVLVVFHKSPLPIDDNTATLIVSTVFTLVMSIINAVHDNKIIKKKEPAK